MMFRFFGDGSRREFDIPVVYLDITSVKINGALTEYAITDTWHIKFEAAPVLGASVDIDVTTPTFETGTGGGLTLEEIQAETISPEELTAAIATIQQDPILAGDIRMFQQAPGGWIAVPEATPALITAPLFISLGLSPTGGGGSTGRQSSWKGNDGNYYCADESGFVYKYNKTTKAWTTTSARPSSINRPGVAPLADGRALFVGGRISTSPTALCHIYDPSADSWTAVANYPVATWYVSACLLSDGKVLACQGSTSGGNTAACYVYDVVANSWTAVASLSAAGTAPFLVPLADRKALANDGSFRIYDSVANSWTAITFNPSPSTASAVAHLGDNWLWFWNASTLGPLLINPITGQQAYVANPSWISSSTIGKSRQTCYMDGDDIVFCSHFSSSDISSRAQWLIRKAKPNLPKTYARKS